MAVLSKLPEVVMVGTSLVVGVTMVMGINAINSAPSFMLEYYKYLAGSPDATPRLPVFWTNILNFYTVVTMVAQAVHEPTNLTSFMCRFSLLSRLELSCVVMMIELLVILIMPHTHTSEYSAIVAMVIVAYIGGAARAYFENTGYALFGPCPSVMLTGMLVGSAVSGALVSIMQIALKAGMPDTFDSVLTQSIIYFCLAMGIIMLAGMLLAALLYNPFARRYVAEFRSSRSPWANIYRPRKKTVASAAASGSQDNSAAQPYLADSGSDPEKLDDEELLEAHQGDEAQHQRRHPDALFDDRIAATREEREEAQGQSHAGSPAKLNPVRGEVMASGKGGLDGEEALAQRDAAVDEGLTTAELLQDVKLWPVVKQIYPMMIACFLTFGITYLVYPGIMVAVDSDDGWFTTLIVAVYNFTDLVGRLMTLWKRLWPPRKAILIGSIVRIVFIPLLVLCATHKIPSHAAAYVFTALMGVSNGFIGTLSMVYSPDTPSLSTDGERAMAGQLTGACLLIGCAVGSLVQLAEVLPFN